MCRKRVNDVRNCSSDALEYTQSNIGLYSYSTFKSKTKDENKVM